MFIGPRALKSLNSIENIEPKMMGAAFNGNRNTTIICYSPTNVSGETDLITFYNDLSPAVFSIRKHNILFNSRGMNSQIGKKVNHKFSSHNLSSRNGEYLKDFTLEIRLTFLNTKFQKRKKKS